MVLKLEGTDWNHRKFRIGKSVLTFGSALTVELNALDHILVRTAKRFSLVTRDQHTLEFKARRPRHRIEIITNLLRSQGYSD